MSPLRHAWMALKYLWARSPCRSVRYKTGLPRGDGTEVPVGRVAVPKDGQKNASPCGDATEIPVGKVAVPKVRYKTGLPREDATEMPVGGAAVPKTGHRIG